MPLVNYAKKEIQFKLIYYGPALCGKTTNLEQIYERVNPRSRGDLTSLATSQDRTLFFDFLPLHTVAIEGWVTKFQIYTVPGQVKYNRTRRLVLRNADGTIFCADSQYDAMEANRTSFNNLSENLMLQNIKLHEMPIVLQYNKRDLDEIAPPEYMDYLLNRNEFKIPVFLASAISGEGVLETLNAIAKLVVDNFIKKNNNPKHL